MGYFLPQLYKKVAGSNTKNKKAVFIKSGYYSDMLIPGSKSIKQGNKLKVRQPVRFRPTLSI
jgi:hypothetical protein